MDKNIDNYVDIFVDDADYEYYEHDLQYEKEEKIYLLLQQIDVLYEKVFGKFMEGDKLIYNPNIFSKLTKEKFRDWIIINNPEIKKLLG